MAAEIERSLGLDVCRAGWRAALASKGTVELVPLSIDHSADSDRIASIVALVVERGSGAPATIVLSADAAQSARVHALAADVAARLGMATDRVRVIDEDTARSVGTGYLQSSRSSPGIADLDDAVIAVGAALVGVDDEHTRGGGAVIIAGAATGGLAGVAGAAVAGGASAAAVPAVGPLGVPVSAVASAGPAGVAFDAGALAGPTGVPLAAAPAGPPGISIGSGAAGPTGVPIGGGGTGPVGGPMSRLGGLVRAHPVVTIVGAIVALGAVVGTVAATGGGSSSAPVVPPSVAVTAAVVTEPVTVPVAAAVEVTEAPATTPTIATTTTGLIAEAVGDACSVGTWIADNESIAGVYTDAFTTAGFALTGVTGSVVVQIDADGTVASTYTDLVISASLQGAGTATVTLNGVDQHTIEFADGTFTVTDTQVGSTMRAEAAGVVLVDGQTPDTMFRGTGPYSCSDAQLDMTITSAVQFTATFTRSG